MTVRARRMPRRAGAQGFTLIEMLVSLAILSMGASLLLAGLVTAGVFARQSRREEAASVAVAAAQMILRTRLERMQPVPRLDVSDPTMDSRGTDKIFDFYGPSADRDKGQGVQRYRLMLTAPGDLILYRAPELSDTLDTAATSVAGWQATTLLRQVAGFSVAYFGARRNETARAWNNFWSNNSRLPEAIRIHVGFRDGDPRVWPDLIVRPGSTVDLACDPEQGTARCGGRS